MAVVEGLEGLQEKETEAAFSLQNSKLLKVELSDVTIQARLGTMVAYQGEVRFEHAGSGGLSRMVKKAMSGEGAQLMKIEGSGEVFLAERAQDIQLLRLDGEAITVNGANLLAFDAGIEWDIRRIEGASGMLSGGLYNVELSGGGWVALVSDGPPLLLEVGEQDVVADPQAAITWSQGVSSSVKTDVNMKTLIGRGSGETVQLAFSGSGWVLIQPSEGPVASTAGAEGGAAGALGNLLGR